MEQLYDKNEPTALSSTSRVSRRSFVGSIVAGATGLYLSGALSGCHRGRVLRVANWADLIGPSTISDFEKEASCTVVYENYSANEELHTKLSRPDAYDVVFPSDYMVQQLAREKRLSQLPHNKFKNLDNLDKRLLGHEYDPTNDFAFPYTYWGTGIAVNQERFPIPKEGGIEWVDLMSPAAAGRVTLLNEMRYTIGMALLMNKRSVNTTLTDDLDLAAKTIMRMKPNIMAFVTDVKDLLIRGETALSYAYSGDVFQASNSNAHITFRVPSGGGIVGIDNMCITAGVREPELAVAFLDFLMRPEVAASLTTSMFYATANKAAIEKHLIPNDLTGNQTIFLPIGESPQLNVLKDLGPAGNDLYVNTWDRVKRA